MSEELKPWKVVPNPDPKNSGMASVRIGGGDGHADICIIPWIPEPLANQIVEAVMRPTEQQQAARISQLEDLLTRCESHGLRREERLGRICEITGGGGDAVKQVETQAARIAELERRFTAPVVCICGSTKFKQAWISENARLTGEGYIVLAVGLWGHHEQIYPPPDVKLLLDEIHKRKIDLCDSVWVLDVGGYIGESTRSEIEYAKRLGKPLRYLSHEIPGYVEPIDCIAQERDLLRERVKELEATITSLTTDVNYEGGVQFWIAKHDAMMLAASENSGAPLKLQSAAKEMAEALEKHCSSVGLSHPGDCEIHHSGDCSCTAFDLMQALAKYRAL